MTIEKAINIFERMLSHYQGELYTDSEREMKEALELGKGALETGEIYMTAVDYNLFLEGYKQGKKDFGRPQGEWKSEEIEIFSGIKMTAFTCNHCNNSYSNMYNFCPNCGAEMKGGKEEC